MIMLQANELMVGDWVFRPACYDQVKEIRRIGVIGIDGMRGLIAFSELEPIPLTEEILEKNGFYREGGASYWYEGDRDACILHWSEDKKQLVIGSPCDDCMVKMNVRYVHELQHAFRLAGIDKEITI